MEKIGSLRVLNEGFTRARSKWAVLGTLYLVNLLIVLPLALAFRAGFSNLVGGFPAIDELFTGFSATIYNDLVNTHGDAVDVFRRMLLPAGIVSLLVHAFVGIGLVRVMDSDGSVREFFGGIVAFGGRAFRLFLVYLLYGGILLTIATIATTIVYSALTEGNAVESAYLAGIIVGGVLIGGTLAVVMLGAEYGRVITVRENRTSMFKTGLDGLIFVVRHPVRMLAMHGSIFVALIGAALIYFVFESAIGMTSAGGVLVMLIVQQAFVLFRLLVRMWNTAGAVRLSAALSDTSRPSYVKAPSVHDRGTLYKEPPQKRQESDPRQQSSDQRGQGEGQRGGYRRRGRRRGPASGGRGRSGGGQGGGGQQGGASQQKPPDQNQSSPSGDRSRRRRRPPRRRGRGGGGGGGGTTPPSA